MIDVVAAVISTDGKINCLKKGVGKFDYLSHKFEFPGGKVESGEDHQHALIREIKEELDTDIVVDDFLLTVEHDYPDFSIRLHFYACTAKQPIQTLIEHVELRLLPPADLHQIPWLDADMPAVDLIVQRALSAAR